MKLANGDEVGDLVDQKKKEESQVNEAAVPSAIHSLDSGGCYAAVVTRHTTLQGLRKATREVGVVARVGSLPPHATHTSPSLAG